MNEKLLQYIWQHRLFDGSSLQTIDEQPVTVLHPGTWNQHQGPDFLHARILIGVTVWVGHVELHIRQSDWQLHAHELDPHYQNVILHVVWQYDRPLALRFPVISLQDRVPKWLLEQYDRLLRINSFIPCEKSIAGIAEPIWEKWKERLLLERCTQKASLFLKTVHQSAQHWEQSFWQLLARCFGNPLNEDLFEAMATGIPVERLIRLQENPEQLEALLFGQSGLLQASYTDAYLRGLQEQYQYLKAKWNLQPVTHPVRLLRMRPAAFPFLRLSQLAATVHAYPQLFAYVRDFEAIQDVDFLCRIRGHAYWKKHYVPDKPIRPRSVFISRQFLHTIWMNAFVPASFAYGHFHQQHWLMEKAIQWLEALPPEQNRICDGFASRGIRLQSAYDSQALLQLKKHYCDVRGCLQCMIGHQLLRKEA